ncbi:hypothetical protein [Anaerovibrio sp. RM50]|uniref:hypothetical protein n=1 Tax=Anaerovibrio sp. RM50 TaxID=1200557 RepID=UPI0004829C04|nr:hypothetical protein [Anaerovibrio sp. RM50]
MAKIAGKTLAISILASLAATVALASPMQQAHQIDILSQTGLGTRGWFVTPAKDKDWEKWHYAITDLDHDGNVEIFKAKEAGLDGAPQLQCEEIDNKTMERRWGVYLTGGSDYPDIFSAPETAAKPHLYENPGDGIYYYIFDSVKWNTEFANTTKTYAIRLVGDLLIDEFAIREWQLSGYDGSETNHYYLPGWLDIDAESDTPNPPPKEIDKAKYDNLIREHLGAGQIQQGSIGWMDTKELLTQLQEKKSFNMLWDSYRTFK